jgi:hypothetical protein
MPSVPGQPVFLLEPQLDNKVTMVNAATAIKKIFFMIYLLITANIK